jgi:hypothetical protein
MNVSIVSFFEFLEFMEVNKRSKENKILAYQKDGSYIFNEIRDVRCV